MCIYIYIYVWVPGAIDSPPAAVGAAYERVIVPMAFTRAQQKMFVWPGLASRRPIWLAVCLELVSKTNMDSRLKMEGFGTEWIMQVFTSSLALAAYKTQFATRPYPSCLRVAFPIQTLEMHPEGYPDEAQWWPAKSLGRLTQLSEHQDGFGDVPYSIAWLARRPFIPSPTLSDSPV